MKRSGSCPSTRTESRFGELVLDLGKIDADLKSRLHRLNCVDGYKSEVIATNPSLRTREFPSMVDALARGQSAEEIVDDFPSLTRDQVEAAIEYAIASPSEGAPISRGV
ncbi:DUF433 domain-containing protein [Bradyrhizobium sp. ISRA442]|uniref:DUF433 domain-containing protein n=1 Tax=Bradyrhizobium sp. ISRA442 TaxID=2866197 RepID=UPI00311AF211